MWSVHDKKIRAKNVVKITMWSVHDKKTRAISTYSWVDTVDKVVTEVEGQWDVSCSVVINSLSVIAKIKVDRVAT